MMKKYLLKIFLAIIAVFVLFKGAVIFYRLHIRDYINPEKSIAPTKRGGFTSLFKPGQKRVKQNGNHDGGYGFARMISLVEASQKVRDLEHLYFSRVLNEPQVETQTIRDLLKSLVQERIRFRRHIDNLKARAHEPLATKKIKSFSYYLRVLDECIQDLEFILTNRVLPPEK